MNDVLAKTPVVGDLSFPLIKYPVPPNTPPGIYDAAIYFRPLNLSEYYGHHCGSVKTMPVGIVT